MFTQENAAELTQISPTAPQSGSSPPIAENANGGSASAEKRHLRIPTPLTLEDSIRLQKAPDDELVSGILLTGSKMMIAAPSKGGKTFLAMYLGASLALGCEWLGHNCKESKVLFVNTELKDTQANKRMTKIAKAMNERLGIPTMNIWKNFSFEHMQGLNLTLQEIVDDIITVVKDYGYDVVIFDPIYKLMNGDENSAKEVGMFCNLLDKLTASTGCSVIFSHHHSKGSQEGKRSYDKASGSGVFARDPDAIFDMDDLMEWEADYEDNGQRVMRVNLTLREFPEVPEFYIRFNEPLFYVDDTVTLKKRSRRGQGYGKYYDNSRKDSEPKETKSHIDPKAILDEAFRKLGKDEITLKELGDHLTRKPRSVRRYVEDSNGAYIVDNSIVRKGNTQ